MRNMRYFWQSQGKDERDDDRVWKAHKEGKVGSKCEQIKDNEGKGEGRRKKETFE